MNRSNMDRINALIIYSGYFFGEFSQAASPAFGKSPINRDSLLRINRKNECPIVENRDAGVGRVSRS